MTSNLKMALCLLNYVSLVSVPSYLPPGVLQSVSATWYKIQWWTQYSWWEFIPGGQFLVTVYSGKYINIWFDIWEDGIIPDLLSVDQSHYLIHSCTYFWDLPPNSGGWNSKQGFLRYSVSGHQRKTSTGEYLIKGVFLCACRLGPWQWNFTSTTLPTAWIPWTGKTRIIITHFQIGMHSRYSLLLCLHEENDDETEMKWACLHIVMCIITCESRVHFNYRTPDLCFVKFCSRW